MSQDTAKIGPNLTVTRLEEVKAQKGEPPWSERVVLTDIMQASVICQASGQGNQRHYHPESDEWWVIMEGELEWEIEGKGLFRVKKDDLVFVPKQTRHHIKVVGDKPAIRMAIGIPDVPHITD